MGEAPGNLMTPEHQAVGGSKPLERRPSPRWGPSSCLPRSAGGRRFEVGDDHFRHREHRLRDACDDVGVGRLHQLGETARNDLPTDAERILAPAARALGASVCRQAVPVVINLVLSGAGNLEAEASVCGKTGPPLSRVNGWTSSSTCSSITRPAREALGPGFSGRRDGGRCRRAASSGTRVREQGELELGGRFRRVVEPDAGCDVGQARSLAPTSDNRVSASRDSAELRGCRRRRVTSQA